MWLILYYIPEAVRNITPGETADVIMYSQAKEPRRTMSNPPHSVVDSSVVLGNLQEQICNVEVVPAYDNEVVVREVEVAAGASFATP